MPAAAASPATAARSASTRAGRPPCSGTFEGEAAGDSEEGGGTGGDVEINADGDVQVSGQMQLTGGFPDGEGGTFFVQAGGSFTQTAAIQMLGNGIDGCGGEMDVSAGRDISLDRIDVSGGSCGAGDVTIEGLGTVTVRQHHLGGRHDRHQHRRASSASRDVTS